MKPNLHFWILPLAFATGLFAAPSAHADVTDDVANFLGLGPNAPAGDTQPPSAHTNIAGDVARFLGLGPQTPAEDIPAPSADGPAVVTAPDRIAINIDLDAFTAPSLPSVAVSELPAPSVETPLHKLFCVEYARAVTGLNIFGDAKYWWERARNLYARAARPAEHAVMVFATSRRLTKGHVAVVTAIVSKREIRVDQANWQNHGEIDHATPVLDVSAMNDWSEVRVWDIGSKSFGGHVYAVSGFIAVPPVQQAAKD